jgi:hypothetical protein
MLTYTYRTGRRKTRKRAIVMSSEEETGQSTPTLLKPSLLCVLFLSDQSPRIIGADGIAVPLTQGVHIVGDLHVAVVHSVLKPALTGNSLRSQSAEVYRLHKSLRTVTSTLACQKMLLEKLVAADDAAIKAADATIKAARDYKSLCRSNSMSHPNKRTHQR